MTKTANNNFKFEITKNDDGNYDYLGNGGDTLDYLATLSETFVQLCKDNQLPVVPSIKANFHELTDSVSVSTDKLFGLHQEKLAAERKAEAFEKNSDELLEKTFLIVVVQRYLFTKIMNKILL